MKITTVGFLGHKYCYINVSEKEVVKRYEKDSKQKYDASWLTVRTIKVKDSFQVYDIWSN